MDNNVKILKLIANSVENKEEILSNVKNIKGVLDAIIIEEKGCILLKYAIDLWSSDYDILVKIMNILLDEYSIDSEIYDLEENLIKEDDFDYVIGKKYQEELLETGEDEQDEKCHIGCSCCGEHSHKNTEDNEKNTKKVKVIELFVSAIVLIIGVILASFSKTEKFANYVKIIAYAIAGYEIIFEGILKLFKGKIFSEDLLMTIASLSAIILGEVTEATFIVLLFSIGELFEHSATENALKVIENLKSLCPESVNVLKEDGLVIITPYKKVNVGDIILVKGGEKIAIDGKVIEGTASIDTKMITGESVYKDVSVGDVVLGGYVNVNGVIKMRAEKTYKDSTLQTIVEIVENSANKKSKKEKFIRKFSKIYTPIVVILALIISVIPPFFYETYLEGFRIWLLRGIMLLCISCPCSLVISVPLTYFCGVGAAANNGVLIKDTATLEKLASCKTVVFDKTGTITEGELKVTKIISTKKYVGKVIKYCAIAEKYSNHPIAKAILSYSGNIAEDGKNFKEVIGRGVEVDYNDLHLVVGNNLFFNELGIMYNDNEEIGTKLFVAVNGEYAGCVILNDTVKKEARGTMLELYDAGVEDTIMLTGDNKAYASKVRKDIEMKKSISNLLPQDKVLELEKIIENSNNTTVAYVGDGVNDAPVITRSDVGFSMGSIGSDLAIESSDVVISDDKLSKVPYTIKLAKRTNDIAKQNIVISLVVKGIVMALALTGLFANLYLSIASDVGVLIVTIINAIRNRNDVI